MRGAISRPSPYRDLIMGARGDFTSQREPSRRNANAVSLARIRSRISINGGHHENRNVASLVSSAFLYLRPDLLVLGT